MLQKNNVQGVQNEKKRGGGGQKQSKSKCPLVQAVGPIGGVEI